ncbi:ABC transporter ATP-binding protein [Devosia sp.]|uniref:ABC transporter ATP-binding protein n=1 Tax=Devosia sp. TaxID=1871048 RepID=UPI002616FDB7|nr:ABC transporter ATP-binding protein [Devosia sp.]
MTDQSAGELQGWGARGTAGVAFAASLDFSDVSVSLGGRTVLDQFNLTIRPGEIICLLGESGSGKSTVLRVAAGIQPVSSGQVSINGDVMSAPGRTVAPNNRGIGLMFQDYALFPHMSVLDNVLFGLKGLGRKAALAQARSALLRVGLGEREADFPHRLSGGQQQRLALARSVAPRPGVLLLDEPFSSLDARLRETVRGETLAVLRETHATSLIVTHDPEEAMLMGDRVALLRAGRIAQIGTASEIYRKPVDLAAARFFSPLAEIEATVRNGAAETPLGPVPVSGHADGARVVVAVRPTGAVRVERNGPGIPGRLVARRDAIGIDICEVKVSGIDAPLGVRRPADGNLTVGEDVFVTLNPEHILVFERV